MRNLDRNFLAGLMRNLFTFLVRDLYRNTVTRLLRHTVTLRHSYLFAMLLRNLMALFVVAIAVTLLSVAGRTLFLVGLAALLHVVCLAFLFIFSPVSFLTNTLVGGVTFVFVVQLVVGHIDGVAVLAVGHRTVRLVAGAIHRLVLSLVDCSAFWPVPMVRLWSGQ